MVKSTTVSTKFTLRLSVLTQLVGPEDRTAADARRTRHIELAAFVEEL